MIRDTSTVVRIGARYNGARLVEQAEFTLALAEQHLTALSPFGITRPRLTEYRALVKAVQKSVGEKTLARGESIQATDKQNKTVLQAKDWLRKLLVIADNTFVHEPAVNSTFHFGPKIGSNVAKLIGALTERIELARAHQKELAEWGTTPAFIKQGEDLLIALTRDDTAQEKAIVTLPATTRRFYQTKGELFVAIKRINRAAKAAFLTDRVVRAQFGLDILYRKFTTRKPTIVVTSPVAVETVATVG